MRFNTTHAWILTAALLLWTTAAGAQPPISWPLAEIRDASTLGLEILNGLDADGDGDRDGVTWNLCSDGQALSRCPSPQEGQTLVERYQLFAVRLNGAPNPTHPHGHDQIYAVALIPHSAWEHGVPLPGLLVLHGYPFIRAAGYLRSLEKGMERAYRLGTWLLAIHGPGFGVVRDASCSTYKDLSGYERGFNYLDKGATWDRGIWESLGLPASQCELVSDFVQGRPCIDTWVVADDGAPAPDLSYLSTAYAYAAMRAITLMKAVALSESTPLTSEVVVAGASFGGLTTFLVNGVDDRVDTAVAEIAAGDLTTSLKEPSAGLRNLLLGATGRAWDDPDVQTALTKIDPIHYAPSQQSPILMLVSAHDPLFVPATYQTTFEAIAAPDKRLHISLVEGKPPGAGHTYADSDQQIRAWLAAHVEGSVSLPPLLSASFAKTWERCRAGIFTWTCPKTRVQVEPAGLESAVTARAVTSATGTDWQLSNDAFHQHKPVPPGGSVAFDLHWNHAVVETEYLLDTGAEVLPFRQSTSWSDARQQFPVYLPPDLARCVEIGACWGDGYADTCQAFLDTQRGVR